MAVALSFRERLHKANMIAGIAIFVMLMITTVMPVEMRWSGTEVAVAQTLPVMCLLGMAFALLQNKGNRKLSLLDVFVIAWYIYYLCRTWAGNEYPCATQFLKDTELFALYFALRGIFCNINVPPAFVVIVLVCLGCYEAVSGLWQMITGGSRHSLYMLTGSFLNPGPYSAFLLIALATGLTAKKELLPLTEIFPKPMRRYLATAFFIMMAVTAVVFPTTWSRAALMALAVVCLWYFRKNYWRWRYAVWGVCLAAAAALYFIKQGSADGRMLTWTASITAWEHSPWLGVGTGGFRHVCAEGIAELYAANPASPLFASGNVAEYAFCDFLKILIEQGFIGAALCIITTAALLHNTYRYSKPLFCSLLALLVFSLFSYPFELYPFRIFTVIMAAVSSSKANTVNTIGCKRIMPAFLTLGGIAIISGYLAKEINIRHKADKEADIFLYSHQGFAENNANLLSKESDNPRFLFIFAKSLRSKGRYNDSNALLRQGVLTSGDPMFFLLQGNNYKDMGCLDLAEKAYMKAYSVMPNRLYPLYRMMLLYESAGKMEKARHMAKTILETSPKINSHATKDIKDKARSLL